VRQMNNELTKHKHDATAAAPPATAVVSTPTPATSPTKPLATYASTVAARSHSVTTAAKKSTTSPTTAKSVSVEAAKKDVAEVSKEAVRTEIPTLMGVSTTPSSSTDGATDAAMRNRRRAVIGVRFKTKNCHTFQESGECRYGDSCVFAHGEEELAKYVAIADAAERAAPTHRQPAKFTIPLPASVDRFLHTDNTWWKNFYNQSSMPAFNPPTSTDGEERKSRDYGFGVSADQERVRALEGNRRVPQAELERHRLQRKAEAIARVNKLTAEGYCGMMAELHNSLGGTSSSYDYNSTVVDADVCEEEQDSSLSGAASAAAEGGSTQKHHRYQSSSSDCGSPCYYGPYIAPGLYLTPNELSCDGITENSSRTSTSDVHQSCAPRESSVSSVSGGGLPSSHGSPRHPSSNDKSHPSSPLRRAIFTHNPYLA